MKISAGSGRGSVYNILLKALQNGDKYGYEICKEIEEKSHGKYILKQPSLYSGLKRLEAQNLITSYWKDSEIGGRRHYYSLTEAGVKKVGAIDFSWEDDRDDLVNSIFKKTELEKTIDDVKIDIISIEKDVSQINNRRKEMEELENLMKQKDLEELVKHTLNASKKTSENFETNEPIIDNLPRSQNVNKNQKKQQFTVSPEQQDLFSFITNIDNDALKSEKFEAKIVEEADKEETKNNDEQQEKVILQNNVKEKLTEKEEETKRSVEQLDLLKESVLPTEKEVVKVVTEVKQDVTPLDTKTEEIKIEENIKEEKSVVLTNDTLKDSKLIEEKIDYVKNLQKEVKVFDLTDEFDRIFEKINIKQKSFSTNVDTTISSKEKLSNLSNSSTLYGAESTTMQKEESTETKEESPYIFKRTNSAKTNDNALEEPLKQAEILPVPIKSQQNINYKNIFGDLLTENEENILNKSENAILEKPSLKNDMPRIDEKNNINITLRPKEKPVYSSNISTKEESVKNFQKPKERLETIPFDQKYAQTAFDIQDYEVRYYQKPSAQQKITKFVAINKLSLLISAILTILLLTTNSMLLVMFDGIFNNLQLIFLVVGFIAPVLYLLWNILKYLVDKDKRKLQQKTSQSFANNLFVSVIIVMLSIAINMFLGMNFQNISEFLLSFYVPVAFACAVVVEPIIRHFFGKIKSLYK